MFRFSTDVLIKVIGAESLLEDLIKISTQCLKNLQDKEWSLVSKLLIQHLCCEQLQGISSRAKTQVLLAILPFIFPVNDCTVSTIMNVFMQQQFVERYNLLSAMSKGEFKIKIPSLVD